MLKGKKFREDGHMLFGDVQAGAKFILLKNDKVVRDQPRSSGVVVYIKLWKPRIWTKPTKEKAITPLPTALTLKGGMPAHVADNEEVQVLYQI